MDAQDKSILYKIKPSYVGHYLQFQSSKLFLKFGLRVMSSLVIALSIRWSLYRIKSLKVDRHSRSKLIVLHKMGGFEDLEEAYIKHRANFDILFMRREYLKLISAKFFSSNVSDLNYLAVTSMLERKRYEMFLAEIFAHLNVMLNVKAVLQFNIVYYAERELGKVCSSIGIKFITLQKEGVRPDISWEKTIEIYYKQLEKYCGYKILVYNHDTANCLIASGVADSSEILEIGMPRLDFAHRHRVNKTKTFLNKNITFYLIDKVAGLSNSIDKDGSITNMRYVSDTGEILYWDNLIKKVNDAVLNIANKHLYLDFQLKGKGRFIAYKYQFDAILPKNVRVVTGATGHYLLANSSVIIAFNSTVIFEGIAAGIPVIVPMMFVSEPFEMRKHTLDLDGAVYYVYNADELESLIVKLYANEPVFNLSKDSVLVLNKYMGNSDGNSSERLREFLGDVINE